MVIPTLALHAVRSLAVHWKTQHGRKREVDGNGRPLPLTEIHRHMGYIYQLQGGRENAQSRGVWDRRKKGRQLG